LPVINILVSRHRQTSDGNINKARLEFQLFLKLDRKWILAGMLPQTDHADQLPQFLTSDHPRKQSKSLCVRRQLTNSVVELEFWILLRRSKVNKPPLDLFAKIFR
jgi:hypothetical protein